MLVATALVAPASASAITREDVVFTASDGAKLAATLYRPDGAAPAGGWPAIVALHGLGGNRGSMNPIAEATWVPRGYAVLTFDARGHGESEGVVSVDGPREIQDLRELVAWLAGRPDVADDRIGAWGISYGGGAVLRGAVEGIPFAAVEVVETWTDLYSALLPQGLAKSGVIAGFVGEIRSPLSPALQQIRDDAFAGRNLDAIKAWGRDRSSRHLLGALRTPTYFFQGRRDFAFGIEQAKAGFSAVRGPKRLYVGAFGHSPSRFPGPDAARVFAEGTAWFDRWLRALPNGVDARPRVTLAPEAARGRFASSAGLPRTFASSVPFRGTRTISTTGRVVRSAGRTQQTVEVFGSPVVRVTATARGGWSRLIAVLTATPPRGEEIVVSAGGVPTRPGSQRYTIRMVDQATKIPARSELRLVLAGDSTKQSPGNLLYLDLPTPAGARITIGRATVSLPVLGRPISR